MPRYAKPSQRPEFFRLNTQSPLARGLVFGSFGQHPGSTFYKDESVYGNHGTLVGYTGAGNLPQDRWGWSDTLGRPVLGFNGSSQDVRATISIPQSNFTIASWLYCTAASNGMSFCVGTSTTDSLFFVRQLSSTQLDIGMYGDGTTITVSNYLSKWTHVAVTFDSSKRITLYVNGESAGSATLSGFFIPASNFRFGNRTDAPANFSGSMADNSIWTRVLATQEISPLADPSNVDLRIGGIPGLLPFRRYYGTGLNTGAALRRRYIASGGN